MELIDILIDRMWRRTRFDSPNGCWLYLGATAGPGYGQVGYKLLKFYIHRVAAAKYLDVPINGEHVVAHKCDVKKCWNPEHLFITTQAGNLADMMEKDRGRFLARERSDTCAAGHVRSPENTYEWKGKLQCLVCKRAHSAAYNEKHRVTPKQTLEERRAKKQAELEFYRNLIRKVNEMKQEAMKPVKEPQDE